MSDTSVTDQGDGHYVELPDEAHSLSWRPNKPPPGMPTALGQLADNARTTGISQDPDSYRRMQDISGALWQRGRDAPTTVASLGPGPTTPFDIPRSSPAQTVRPRPQPWSQPVGPPPPSPRDTPPLSPTGVPPPIRQFTPYIPAMPTRNANMWGSPYPYPRMPMGFEIPGINQGVGSWFAQNGSGITALLGAGSSKFAADFIKSYTQGMETKTKLQREQMLNQSLALEQQQKEESDAYAEIVNTYQANDYKPLNGVTFEQAMEEVAGQYNDQNMINTVATSGAGGAYKLLQNRDAKWQDQHASNAQAQKEIAAEGSPEERAAWGLPAAATPAATGALPGSPAPPPGTTGSVGMAPPSSPGVDRTPAGNIAAPDDSTDPEKVASADTAHTQSIMDDVANDRPTPASKLMTKGGTLKPYQQIGLDMARGADVTGLPKWVSEPAHEYASNVDNQMDNIVANSDGKSEDQIYKELSGISPSIAHDWKALVDGRMGLPGGMAAIGARPYWRNMSDLALAVKPSWTASDFNRISTLNHEYDAGPTGRRMSRVESMSAAGKALLRALNDVGDEPPPVNGIEAWFNKTLSGDSKWGRVFSAYNTYVQEAQSIASQTGNFHEGDVQRVMRETPYTSGVDFLRGVVAKDAETASETINDLNDDYVSVIGHDALHYNKKAVASLAAMASYDPKTGKFVGSVPKDMQGLDAPAAPAAPPAAPPPAPSAAPSSGWGTLQ